VEFLFGFGVILSFVIDKLIEPPTNMCLIQRRVLVCSKWGVYGASYSKPWDDIGWMDSIHPIELNLKNTFTCIA